MRKRLGKITEIAIIVLCMAAVLAFYRIDIVKADTHPSLPHVIHKGMGFTAVDNVYAIISPVASCDMYNSSGAVETTYANAAITYTADAEYADEALATMPALPKSVSRGWEITFYENATPTAGDTPILGPLLWNPIEAKTFTDTRVPRPGDFK